MDNCCICSSEAFPWVDPSSTQETGSALLDTLISSYSKQALTWQQNEGPCLPSLTLLKQWLIKPLQPPCGKTHKYLILESRLSGRVWVWCSVVPKFEDESRALRKSRMEYHLPWSNWSKIAPCLVLLLYCASTRNIGNNKGQHCSPLDNTSFSFLSGHFCLLTLQVKRAILLHVSPQGLQGTSVWRI